MGYLKKSYIYNFSYKYYYEEKSLSASMRLAVNFTTLLYHPYSLY